MEDHLNTYFWTVNITDFIVHVNSAAANSIRVQYEKGDELLFFIDVLGATNIVPRKDFRGMFESSDKIRDKADAHNNLFDSRKKEWE